MPDTTPHTTPRAPETRALPDRRFRVTAPVLLLALVTCLAAALLPASLRKCLWDPDATRYGQVAREMLQTGDWIVPRLAGRLYTHKPPLYFWAMAAASSYAGDITPFGSRVPAILSVLLTVIATFWFAGRVFGRKAGLAAAVVLATGMGFIKSGQEVRMDAMLTLWSTLGMALFFFGFRDARRRMACYLGAGVALALATLTKGPVGFVPQLLVMTAYALLRRRWRNLFCRELIVGTAVFLGLVLAWFAPLCLRPGVGARYLRDLVGLHIGSRFFGGEIHVKPLHFFLLELPLIFYPWIVFLPGGLVYCMRRLRRTGDDATSFVLLWAVLTFAFFSLSKSKSETYILPMLPALACIVGVYWQGLLDNDSHVRGMLRGTIPLAVLFWLYFGMWAVIPGFVGRTGPAAFITRRFLLTVPVHVAIFGGTLAALELFRHNRRRASLACLAGMMFIVCGYALGGTSPAENERRSHRLFLTMVKEQVEPDATMAAFYFNECSLYYYGGFTDVRRITRPRILRTLAAGRQMYILARNMHLGPLIPLLNAKAPRKLYVLAREGDYDRDLVLLATPGLRAEWLQRH